MALSELHERIGRRVKAMRVLRGVTQAQLAEKTGMSTQTLSNLELGKVNCRLDTLRAVETALECTLILVPNEDLE